jgi:fatty acid amide hydrolase 2
MNPLTLCSAQALAALIRSGRTTAAAAVEAHIQQILKVNRHLNAQVEECFAAAREEAAQADDRRRSAALDELPPLHGVPCSIKECFAVAGMRNTGGLWARRAVVAAQDATAVRRLREAGAIVLGTTNVSELCMWMESDNTVYGLTRNPYRTSRTVGGSSGGEAALIACGGAPFGLGSDVGGSIRMPAFFTGIFGHKPSGGLVPNTGQYPNAHGPATRYLTTGPLCRRAADLMPLLRLLAGPDEAGGEAYPEALNDPAAVDLAALEVLVVPGNGVIPVSRDVATAQRRAARALQAAGATVREAHFRHLRYSLPIWSARMHAAGGPTFRELMGEGVAVDPIRELGRAALRRSRHTLPAIGLGLLEALADRLPGAEARFLTMADELKAELDRALTPRTVILYPPYPTAAPRHGRPLFPPFNWVYTAIVNAMLLPATQVPIGQDADGLPLGGQVIGPQGHDYLPIAVASYLERTCGGWSPPLLAR